MHSKIMITVIVTIAVTITIAITITIVVTVIVIVIVIPPVSWPSPEAGEYSQSAYWESGNRRSVDSTVLGNSPWNREFHPLISRICLRRTSEIQILSLYIYIYTFKYIHVYIYIYTCIHTIVCYTRVHYIMLYYSICGLAASAKGWGAPYGQF